MPHAWIEYSVNIENTPEVSGLGRRLYDAMVETGIFPVAGIRVRLMPIANSLVGDLGPENSFVHVALKVGEGRTPEVIKTATDTIFGHVSDQLRSLADRQPLAIAMVLDEIDGRYSYKMNNLRRYMAEG